MSYDLFCSGLKATLPRLDTTRSKNDPYTYRSLTKATRTFRLAVLYPGCFRDRLRCSFFEVPFEAAPNYVAVSYTWGNPAKASIVWTDHGKIEVTASLDSVFRKLRDPKRFLVVWIDGICINQQDGGEKGRQVRLMREIYARATETYIYLGEEADGSFQIPWLFERIQIATGKAGYWHPEMTGFRANGTTQLLPNNYHQFGLPEKGDSRWNALKLFLTRPWFRRVWIIQEAIVSQSATVLCGDWKMRFEKFLYTLVLAVMSNMPMSGSSTSDSALAVKMAWLINILHESYFRGQRWQLSDLLHRCRVASATDSRDFCYGILGLSAQADEEELKPSYGEDVSETYLRYASYFVRMGDGIQVLYNAGSTMSGLPSWVPDWSDKTGPGSRLCPEPNAEADTRLRTPFAYAAGSGRGPDIRTVIGRANILQVNGIRIDIISKLTVPVGRVKSPTTAVWKLVRELQDLLHTPTKSCYSKDVIDTMTWKTMIANRKSGLQEAAGPEYAESWRAFDISISADDNSWPTIEPNVMVEKSQMFVNGAVAVCQKRLRGITKLGLPGQFPDTTKEGDFVFIPCGSALPFVIRSCPEFPSKFRFIGECYVYGLMEGQAFDGNESSIEVLNFI